MNRKPGIDWPVMTQAMLEAGKGQFMSHDPSVDGIQGQIVPLNTLVGYLGNNLPLPVNYSLSEQDTGLKDPGGRAIYQRTWYWPNGTDTPEQLAGITNNAIHNLWLKLTCYRHSEGFSVHHTQGLTKGATDDDPYTVLFSSSYSDIYLTLRYTKQ